MLIAKVPSAEMAILFKTGSEATTAALRIARASTGRCRVAYCGYHGWHDWCLPMADYVPQLSDQVIPFAAWDPGSLQRVLEAFPSDFAAVMA